MSRIVPVLAVVSSLAIHSTVALAAQNVRVGDVEAAEESRVDSLFAEVDSPTSPGVALVVVKGGEVVLRKGYGSANLEHRIPITPGTVFDIASVSKQFAGMAISMLVDDGTIGLDDDVREYLPELHDFGPTITIDHLVHHTSGIRDWPGTLAVAGWRMDDVISFDQILGMAFGQRELNFVPGSEYTYSNTGFNLLAEVVARVTGQTFRKWTDKALFQPLGMTKTHFQDDHTEVIPDRAYGYTLGEDETYTAVPDLLTAMGSSSLYTTVDDLAKWLINFDDPVVGGPGVIERMKTRGVLNDGSRIAYAFGVNVGEFRGRTTVSHGGSWAGFRTALLHFPDEDFGVVVLANHSPYDPTGAAQDVADIYLGSGPGSETAETAGSEGTDGPVSISPTVLADYLGSYRLGPGRYVAISQGEGGLRTMATGESSFPMMARSETEFWVEGYGAAITFRRDGTGRVTHFSYRGIEARKLADSSPHTPAQLLDLTGEYVSDELDTAYRITLEEGALVAHHFRHGAIHLSPAWGEDFSTDAWFIRSIDFQRGPDGAVVGFLVDGGARVRNLWFERKST
jgi:CubicO group peptidase (beta-lactamase class C family)